MKQSDKQVPRRSFLASTTLAGGTLALSRTALAQTDANNTLNVALIGCGAQGQAIINACMKGTGIHFQAICDIWENYNLKRTSTILSGFKQEHKAYTSYQEMLASENGLDAVIIATPDSFHAEQTVACLEAGLPVYCEGMMSNTLVGAQQMLKAAREANKPLQIGLQKRSNPLYQHAYTHIINETKLLGNVTAINAQWNRSVRSLRGWPRRFSMNNEALKSLGFKSMKQFRNWQWDKQFGSGPLGEFGSQQFDVLNWFLGTTPKSVYATGGIEYYEDETYQWPDTVMVVLEYDTPKGTIRAFYQTISSNSNFGFFENFMGNEGTLYLSESPGRCKVYREPGAPDWDKWVRLDILKSLKPPETKESDGSLTIQETVLPPMYDLPIDASSHPLLKSHLDNFFATIRGNAQLNASAESAYLSTVTTLKVIESCKLNKRIKLTADDFTI